jgi:hypothetical protein
VRNNLVYILVDYKPGASRNRKAPWKVITMPGIIPHLIAVSMMFIIGRYYFKGYFDPVNKSNKNNITNNKTKENITTYRSLFATQYNT